MINVKKKSSKSQHKKIKDGYIRYLLDEDQKNIIFVKNELKQEYKRKVKEKYDKIHETINLDIVNLKKENKDFIDKRKSLNELKKYKNGDFEKNNYNRIFSDLINSYTKKNYKVPKFTINEGNLFKSGILLPGNVTQMKYNYLTYKNLIKNEKSVLLSFIKTIENQRKCNILKKFETETNNNINSNSNLSKTAKKVIFRPSTPEVNNILYTQSTANTNRFKTMKITETGSNTNKYNNINNRKNQGLKNLTLKKSVRIKLLNKEKSSKKNIPLFDNNFELPIKRRETSKFNRGKFLVLKTNDSFSFSEDNINLENQGGFDDSEEILNEQNLNPIIDDINQNNKEEIQQKLNKVEEILNKQIQATKNSLSEIEKSKEKNNIKKNSLQTNLLSYYLNHVISLNEQKINENKLKTIYPKVSIVNKNSKILNLRNNNKNKIYKANTFYKLTKTLNKFYKEKKYTENINKNNDINENYDINQLVKEGDIVNLSKVIKSYTRLPESIEKSKYTKSFDLLKDKPNDLLENINLLKNRTNSFEIQKLKMSYINSGKLSRYNDLYSSISKKNNIINNLNKELINKLSKF